MPAGGEKRRGSRNGASKLTAEKVREIRRRKNAGEYTRALATEFGVHRDTIFDCCDGTTWGWLD